jgi:DNA-binding NarL/FixJ family response regulator
MSSMSLKAFGQRKGVAKVLIVDDHPIVRQGLRAMIDAEPDLHICGEAETEREARGAIRALEPDAVVIDLSLEEGDGINLVRDAHAHHPDIALLVLSMHDESIYAERLLQVGAAGYIMKQAASDQLITALRTVLRGDTYLSQAMRARLGGGRGSDDEHAASKLSTRELQVIGMIGRGQS